MTNEELQKATIKADIELQKMKDNIHELYEENKQLKEELENDIDRYEDTISYQLGFDKGKEYLQQRIDKAIKYIKELQNSDLVFSNIAYKELLEILGKKEIKEIPQFKGTLEQLDNLTILGDKENE